MQCPSCTFQNMPGSARCARCGAVLTFAGTAIDVYPPRATALGKSLVGLWRFRTLGRRLREALSSGWQWGGIRAAEMVRFDLPTVLRCVVPGWANIRTGHRLQGSAFLAIYSATAIPGLVMLGTSIGAMLLGIAFAIHTCSVVTALVPRFEMYRDRLVFTGFCGVVLAFLLYMPLGTVLAQFATPLSINQHMPSFFAGDVVWYHPTRTVHAGQFALYNSSGLRVATRTTGGQNAQLIVQAGLRINRVIATEGQTLTWENGNLLIDHKPVELQLLPSEFNTVLPSITVPSSCVLIDPSNLVPGGRPGSGSNAGEVHGQHMAATVRIDPQVWQNLSFVPVDSLLGVVFYRSWPLSRVGFPN